MEAARRPVTASFSLLRNASSLRFRSLASMAMTPTQRISRWRGAHRVGADQPRPVARPPFPHLAELEVADGLVAARRRAAQRLPDHGPRVAKAVPAASFPNAGASATPVISANTWLTRTTRQLRSKKGKSDGRVGQHGVEQRKRVVESCALLGQRGDHAIEGLDQVAHFVVNRDGQRKTARVFG